MVKFFCDTFSWNVTYSSSVCDCGSFVIVGHVMGHVMGHVIVKREFRRLHKRMNSESEGTDNNDFCTFNHLDTTTGSQDSHLSTRAFANKRRFEFQAFTFCTDTI